MLTRGDEYRRALDYALAQIMVAPDATADHVAALIVEAEREARESVAARWIAEERRRDEERDRRREQREHHDHDRDRAERGARKRLRRVDGGDEVDLTAEYWLLAHRLGTFAFARHRGDEDAGPLWSPPVIAGKRTDRRSLRGLELADVDGLVAVVADLGAARETLRSLAEAARAEPEPVGVIEEDPE